jgi:gluconolactonase
VTELVVQVEVRDSRFWQVIGTGTRLEQVTTGFQFLEGPAWHPHGGYLVFSDIVGDCLYRWSRAEGVTVFRKPSHMANGNTFDRQGRLLTCEHATSRVTCTYPDGRIEVLASHYNDKELNSPNDIVVRSDRSIYFTDPNSGRGPRFGIAREQELPFQGVYRLGPDNDRLTLLMDDFSKPNGLCFSPDEKLLFVNDTDRRHIRVFDVQPDGTVTGGRVWAILTRDGEGVADGMKVDAEGNLYCCGPGGIHLFDCDANYLGVIQMPEHTTNLAWGDGDLRSLYITALAGLYRIRTVIPGQSAFKQMCLARKGTRKSWSLFDQTCQRKGVVFGRVDGCSPGRAQPLFLFIRQQELYPRAARSNAPHSLYCSGKPAKW